MFFLNVVTTLVKENSILNSCYKVLEKPLVRNKVRKTLASFKIFNQFSFAFPWEMGSRSFGWGSFVYCSFYRVISRIPKLNIKTSGYLSPTFSINKNLMFHEIYLPSLLLGEKIINDWHLCPINPRWNHVVQMLSSPRRFAIMAIYLHKRNRLLFLILPIILLLLKFQFVNLNDLIFNNYWKCIGYNFYLFKSFSWET
jgi:hypothetical protein